jgi:polysaccharide biosynthesis protein PslG
LQARDHLSSGAIALALLAAAVLPAPASAAATGGSSSLFGVNVQTHPSGPEFEAMREGGVATYRWPISWAGVHPGPESPPDWTATDPVMANLARNGIKALPVLHGSPCFVVQCAPRDPPDASSRPPLDSVEARTGWATFLGELVGRYGPGGSFWSENPDLPERPIRLWQIWNEPNAPQFYRPAPSALEYAELVELSSDAIKSVDPEAVIMLGGLPGQPHKPGGIEATRFLDELYRLGAQRHFDAVAIHPYSPDLAGVRSQVAAARRVLEGHADTETPIWVTELGWGASGGNANLVETVEGQAEMLRRAFGLLAARRDEWNVGGALWYAWRDPPGGASACIWCRSSGLIDADGNPRPSWTAFAELSGGAPVSPGALPGNGGPDDGGAADAEAGEDGAGDGGPLPVLALIAAALALAGVAAAWLARRRATRR